ncbi:hypothetical protein CVT26_002657 [Gymnopilus dilepis]|uniref:Uncharacterized protein n=1 Tax=Gymnopilus dilepis TaxID=231916 RepID=A0A409VE74_9AGAR|nr:hypothetical protein CVT26_002657 [Gymnopilus dilepis]
MPIRVIKKTSSPRDPGKIRLIKKTTARSLTARKTWQPGVFWQALSVGNSANIALRKSVSCRGDCGGGAVTDFLRKPERPFGFAVSQKGRGLGSLRGVGQGAMGRKSGASAFSVWKSDEGFPACGDSGDYGGPYIKPQLVSCPDVTVLLDTEVCKDLDHRVWTTCFFELTSTQVKRSPLLFCRQHGLLVPSHSIMVLLIRNLLCRLQFRSLAPSESPFLPALMTLGT